MQFRDLNVSSLRLLILTVLLLSLPGCRSSSNQRGEAVLGEAVKIGHEQTKVSNQWAREFGQTFSEQNRAQFPSNREWLNSRAQDILPLMAKSIRLCKEAVEKYEEASRLISNEHRQRGLATIAASFRKSIEIEQLFKVEAQLTSDQTIKDAKVLNEKFAYYDGLIREKQKEMDAQFEEGKRLMVMQ